MLCNSSSYSVQSIGVALGACFTMDKLTLYVIIALGNMGILV